jgi:hypothetical protein
MQQQLRIENHLLKEELPPRLVQLSRFEKEAHKVGL